MSDEQKCISNNLPGISPEQQAREAAWLSLKYALSAASSTQPNRCAATISDKFAPENGIIVDI